MVARVAFVFALGVSGGCLDTHDASLGEQEESSPADAAPDVAADEAGLPALDAGAPTQRDAEPDSDDEGEERDAATSLLCRLEPWHCL